MHILCILVMVFSTSYFLFAKRTFDFFSIAIFSGLFYFSPAIWGYAYHPYWEMFDPLTTSVYGIVIAYCVSFSLGAIVKDLFLTNTEQIAINRLPDKLDNYGSIVLSIAYLSSFIYLLYLIGTAAFTLPKVELMGQLGIGFSILCSSSLIGLIYWYKRSWLLFALVVLGILYLLIMGYRFLTVLGFLSLITFCLSRKNKQVLLLKEWKIVLSVFAAAILLFVGGLIYSSIKQSQFSIMSSTENIDRLVIASEPMVIQENLNLVLKNNYHVPNNYVLTSLLLELIPFSSKLGLKAVNFNELTQPYFYKNYKYGVGSNIWAEMFALGGFPLLYSFMIGMVVLCLLMSLMLERCSINVCALIIPIGMILYFYIHRNDLTYTINLIRNVLLIWVAMNIYPLYLKMRNWYHRLNGASI